MDNLSFLTRTISKIIGLLYAFFYYASRYRFLGVPLNSWLTVLSLVLLLLGLQRGSGGMMIAGLILVAVTFYLSRRARRDNYVSFVALSGQVTPGEVRALSDDQKILLKATGVFSVNDQESYLLQRPAEYWRVPAGDHAIMAEHRPGRFMYQFIQPGTVQEIRYGYLIFGTRSHKALSISYLTTWGPEFSERSAGLFSLSRNGNTGKMRRQIYLTFNNDEDRRAVWHNLLRDAGQPIDEEL